jgi:aryl-alcohol dehydrogenase-like predicted oxidoreductase
VAPAANNYGVWADGVTGDESEQLLGRWLTRRQARDRVVLATKAGAKSAPGRGRSWPANAEGLAAPTVRAALEHSLRRLGTEHVDLFYAHIDDQATPLAETVGAFAGLIEQGKATVAGASNYRYPRLRQARDLAAARQLPPYRVLQQRHSYLRPGPGAACSAAATAARTGRCPPNTTTPAPPAAAPPSRRWLTTSASPATRSCWPGCWPRLRRSPR